MRFLLIAVFVAVASANPARLIVPGPAGPTPVVDDSGNPVILDESPISVGPVIIDESDYSPISVGPAIVDPVGVEPSISPLVQVIINVKSQNAVAESPVAIEEINPSPVAIEEVNPSPVSVVESPQEIIEQPIIDAPIFPSPAVVLPDELN